MWSCEVSEALMFVTVKSQLKIHYRTNSQYSEYNAAVIASQGGEAAVVYASRCVLLKSGGSHCTLGDYL